MILKGKTYRFQDRDWVCEMVNDSRAYLVPARKKKVEYKTRFGKPVRFETVEAGINVSPNSEIDEVKAEQMTLL